MNSNFYPNLKRSLSVNPWILIIVCLLPIGIGSIYFIQEHRYQTEKTEKVALQEELSKAKNSLQNIQNQISKDSAQIESANQEIKSLKTRLENSSKETQELRNKLTSVDKTAKALSTQISTQKSAFTQCMTQVGNIVETTRPLYQKIQEYGLSRKTLSMFPQGLTALGKFTELHAVWEGKACKESQQLSSNQ
ncbi:hypothetical protein [Stenomitos frigidus]|uniref:Uncharacterized protein n=1 Tax=Stenomitos frigidus ULC18 TaxID=2107698 RepID=A0A2T1EQ96_9CYAN|nr:hypothetical protein [Stenomitos frigidus]PSB34891.1 hypothetical protein C7B82_01595 [Stenomitos frigidus ULC18]